VRRAAALVHPFIFHPPDREPSRDPSNESPHRDIDRTSNEDENDDFQIDHAPQRGLVPVSVLRTPATAMDTLQTSQPVSEGAIGVIQSSIEFREIEKLIRHLQIRDITLRSLERAPTPSSSRIGAIFVVKKGALALGVTFSSMNQRTQVFVRLFVPQIRAIRLNHSISGSLVSKRLRVLESNPVPHRTPKRVKS
jgi:hypothetical protein